jgi:hypothetical protein
MRGVDYTKPTTPPDYVCHDCKVTGVKLWREYQTECPRLLCVDCAGRSQKKDVSKVSEDGYRPGDESFPARCDQIGWYVPAVPDEEGMGYWGYTSVLEPGVQWWRKLPLRATGGQHGR